MCTLNKITLIFLHCLILLLLHLSLLFPLFLHALLHLGLFYLVFFHLNLFLKALIIRFFLGNFATKHLNNPLQLLVFNLVRNVPTQLKHHFLCKCVMSFEPVLVNVEFTFVSMCQRFKVVRSAFCHSYVFLVKPLFTAANLVRSLTVYNIINSVNSAHDIRRAFPSVDFTASIHRYFSYRRYGNVTDFSLPSSVLLSSPGSTPHSPISTSKLKLSSRPSFPPETKSLGNFQHLHQLDFVFFF